MELPLHPSDPSSGVTSTDVFLINELEIGLSISRYNAILHYFTIALISIRKVLFHLPLIVCQPSF